MAISKKKKKLSSTPVSKKKTLKHPRQKTVKGNTKAKKKIDSKTAKRPKTINLKVPSEQFTGLSNYAEDDKWTFDDLEDDDFGFDDLEDDDDRTGLF